MSDDYLVALDAIVKLSSTEPYQAVADRYIALIAQRPQRAEAYQSLALYAGLCGQWPAAHFVIDEALALPQGQARSHYIKARICDEALDPPGAIANYERALKLDPGNSKWRFNLGLAQLTLGDFENGTANYRQRFSPAEQAALGSTPAWQPNQTSGKTLIWAEQGLGDELMFARLLPCLQAHPGRYTLQCDRRLLSTLRLNHPWLDFVPRGELAPLLPGFDAQLALGDLLALFHRELARPGVRDRVLKPAPRADLALPIREGGPQPRTRIGISWLSMNAEYGAQRSLPLALLLDAFSPDRHTLVNLQYLAPPEQLQAIRDRGFELINSVNAFEDVEGLAALAAQCDSVVSIDNSTLHLAGALGISTCALIPRLPNWRWLLQTPDSYWYPSVALMRQALPFDWSAEIAALRLRFSGGV
jgi:hypothetical protein